MDISSLLLIIMSLRHILTYSINGLFQRLSKLHREYKCSAGSVIFFRRHICEGFYGFSHALFLVLKLQINGLEYIYPILAMGKWIRDRETFQHAFTILGIFICYFLYSFFQRKNPSLFNTSSEKFLICFCALNHYYHYSLCPLLFHHIPFIWTVQGKIFQIILQLWKTYCYCDFACNVFCSTQFIWELTFLKWFPI